MNALEKRIEELELKLRKAMPSCVSAAAMPGGLQRSHPMGEWGYFYPVMYSGTKNGKRSCKNCGYDETCSHEHKFVAQISESLGNQHNATSICLNCGCFIPKPSQGVPL